MKKNNRVYLSAKHSNDTACRIILDKTTIKQKISDLATRLNDYFADKKNIVLICIMKGGQRFMFELIRHLKFDFEIDFLGISSYAGKIKPNKDKPTLTLKTSMDLTNKNVIIIDDVIESGRTVRVARDYLISCNCFSTTLVAFVHKTNKHYNWKKLVGFYAVEVEDKFLVGYGFDLNNRYRDLNFVCYIEFSCIFGWFCSSFRSIIKRVKKILTP